MSKYLYDVLGWILILFVFGMGQASANSVQIYGHPLRNLADQQQVLIGAAVEPDLLDEPLYADILASQYNCLTPENRMKWQFIHPGKETYDFSGGDRLVEFAMQHQMQVRGHTLVWHNQNPSWLESGTWTKEDLLEILKDHITQVAGHYQGKIYAWDVVNEPIDDSGALRESFWQQIIGSEYLEKAFIWANEADPQAKLILNDYGVEEVNVKSTALYNLVKDLLAKKVPVHGVGLQFHLNLDTPPDFASVFANVKRFVELGIEVHFTEIDVRIQGEPTDKTLFAQADVYKKLMEIALNFPACKVYTMWGFTDAHSWIPQFSKGYGAALIFDQNYNPKPAYYILQETLQKGPVELNYPTDTGTSTGGRHIVPPYRAMRAPKIPTIDGKIEPGEWDAGVLYPFAYNQLNPTDQCPPMDVNDLYGTWKILYDKNIIYGLVQRIDDVTVTTHKDDWENDNLEVFFDLDGTFAQLRTIVGKEWANHPLQGNRKAVWSQDGKVLEFLVELPADDVTGRTIGWNIALSDNDQGPDSTRKYQLYPIYGFNDSWQGKNLCELKFTE